jgi:Ras-related protein Rab-21
VTDPESLVKAKNWIRELRNMLGDSVCLALVANKIDLLDRKCPPTQNPVVQEAITYAASLEKAKHYLTSAKLNEGLQELFFDLTKRMMDFHKKSRPVEKSTSPSITRTLRIQDDDEDQLSPESGSVGNKCSC